MRFGSGISWNAIHNRQSGFNPGRHALIRRERMNFRSSGPTTRAGTGQSPHIPIRNQTESRAPEIKSIDPSDADSHSDSKDGTESVSNPALGVGKLRQRLPQFHPHTGLVTHPPRTANDPQHTSYPRTRRDNRSPSTQAQTKAGPHPARKLHIRARKLRRSIGTRQHPENKPRSPAASLEIQRSPRTYIVTHIRNMKLQSQFPSRGAATSTRSSKTRAVSHHNRDNLQPKKVPPFVRRSMFPVAAPAFQSSRQFCGCHTGFCVIP